MGRVTPIAVGEKSAAAMMDMNIEDFRDLVSKGSLPSPKPIGGHERWSVADLQSVLDGSAMDEDDFTW